MPNPPKKTTQALIRVRDGQNCLFPSFHLIWSKLAGECQDSHTVFFAFFSPKLPARLKASRGNSFWKAQRSCCRGGKMGTSVEDAMTFRLFMTVGAVSMDVLWSPSFFIPLRACSSSRYVWREACTRWVKPRISMQYVWDENGSIVEVWVTICIMPWQRPCA